MLFGEKENNNGELLQNSASIYRLHKLELDYTNIQKKRSELREKVDKILGIKNENSKDDENINKVRDAKELDM